MCAHTMHTQQEIQQRTRIARQSAGQKQNGVGLRTQSAERHRQRQRLYFCMHLRVHAPSDYTDTELMSRTWPPRRIGCALAGIQHFRRRRLDRPYWHTCTLDSYSLGPYWAEARRTRSVRAFGACDFHALEHYSTCRSFRVFFHYRFARMGFWPFCHVAPSRCLCSMAGRFSHGEGRPWSVSI